MASLNEVAKNGSSYMSPEYAATLTPDQLAMAVYGSKMTLVLELFTITTLWLVKFCLLILYHRLTLVLLLVVAPKLNRSRFRLTSSMTQIRIREALRSHQDHWLVLHNRLRACYCTAPHLLVRTDIRILARTSKVL